MATVSGPGHISLRHDVTATFELATERLTLSL
jgi:hypothetical protein